MATAAPIFDNRTMSIGRVFTRALGAIRTNPVVILGLVVLIGAIPGLLLAYFFGSAAAGLAAEGATSGFITMTLVMMVISMLIATLVQAALTRATVAAIEGKKASFSDSLSASLQVVLPLIGLSILFSLGFALGLVLLVVPGIILLLMWSVAVPALVVEREGVFEAFSRSRELTKGARWKILGLFIVLGVIYVLLESVLRAVGIADYDPSIDASLSPAAVVGTLLLSTVFNAVWGTMQPSLYVELREWKEGKSAADLEQIFS